MHRVICTECFVCVAEPTGAVVADDSPFVRFLEAHRAHRVVRRVVRQSHLRSVEREDEPQPAACGCTQTSRCWAHFQTAMGIKAR